MLGQKTELIEEQLAKYWDWGAGGRVLADDEELVHQRLLRRLRPGRQAEIETSSRGSVSIRSSAGSRA